MIVVACRKQLSARLARRIHIYPPDEELQRFCSLSASQLHKQAVEKAMSLFFSSNAWLDQTLARLQQIPESRPPLHDVDEAVFLAAAS